MVIEKPTIIVTSLGRTGTKFFASLFDGILTDGTALHQPDIVSREQSLATQFRESGFFNLAIYRTVGRWSLIRLSDKRVAGAIDRDAAIRALLRQRRAFVASKPGRTYVESSSGYYGLIDLVPEAYAHARVVYLVRDGRDWVRSQMKWGGLYSEKNVLRRTISHTWLTAKDFAGDPYHSQWAAMTRFQKVCWAWAKLNEYALNTLDTNPHARLFYFEDIFNAEDRYERLDELIRFATTFSSYGTIETASLQGWLDRQVNQSVGEFPTWSNWSPQQKAHFEATCGPLMRRLGYDY